MKNRDRLAGRFTLALVLGFALFVRGQAAPTSAAAPIDPAAMAALHKMGAYLRTLKAFQVKAVTTTEDVLADGQKLQYSGTTDLLAQRPDKLRVIVANDRQDRTFYYNGKVFTLWGQRNNFYATVAAPPTIGALADQLSAKFAVELPLVDLFRWGSPESTDTAITAAMTAGAALIEDTSCTRYAFRQAGLDWQIWIQNGDSPLPRKLVLTTLTDEARPQSTIAYTWNLAPAYNDVAFTFVPYAGAMKISLAETAAGTPTK